MASDYKVHLYSPVENGGTPLHYNWFGANKVNLIGKHTKGNTGSGHLSYPGQPNQPVFTDIKDSQWASGVSRPTYNIGLLNNTNNHNSDYFYVTACPCGANVQKNLKGYNKGVPGPKYNDKGEIKYLFEEGGAHHRGFITDFYGNYNNTEKKKYYQNFAFEVINTTDEYYPFAVKGVAFTIRVPAGSDNLDATGRKQQYGDHIQINYMHGLWIDKDGKYHQHELYPNGDNAGKAKVTAIRTAEWNKDPSHTPYFFLRSGDATGTYEFLRDNFPDTNEAMKIRAFTMKPDVKDYWFVGFSCSMSSDKAGGEAFAHTLQWSNLAPIPFFSPRPPMSFKHTAVMGALTPLDELKEGKYRILDYEGRKTRGGFKSNDTTYLPDNVVPGYGENGDFDPPPPGSDDPDAAPDDFSFNDIDDAEPKKRYYSDRVTVTGFNGRILISSDENSEIQVEDGDWVAGGNDTFVPILPDQNFRLRMIAPEYIDMSISTECVVGGSDPVVWTINNVKYDGPPSKTPNPYPDVRGASVKMGTASNRETERFPILGITENINISWYYDWGDKTGRMGYTKVRVYEDNDPTNNKYVEHDEVYGSKESNPSLIEVSNGQWFSLYTRSAGAENELNIYKFTFGDGPEVEYHNLSGSSWYDSSVHPI